MCSPNWLDKCSSQLKYIKSEVKIMVAVRCSPNICILIFFGEDHALPTLINMVCAGVGCLCTYWDMRVNVHMEDIEQPQMLLLRAHPSILRLSCTLSQAG